MTFSSELIHKWALLLSYSQNNNLGIYDKGLFYGKDFNNPEIIKTDLNNTLRTIRDELKAFNLTSEENNCIENRVETQEELNRLHSIFEKYYPIVRNNDSKSESHGPEFLQTFRRINYLIHIVESVLDTENNNSFIEILLDKEMKPSLLMDSDQVNNSFSKDLLEKIIYLNYFQGGYSVIAAYNSNSRSVPIPQQKFCANHFMYLKHDQVMNKSEENKVLQWIENNHPQISQDKPLRLGHIPLAKIVSSKSTSEIVECLVGSSLLNIKLQRN